MPTSKETILEQGFDIATPAIVSASRRTDIPAFYADWFFHRLQLGYAIVANPFNPLKKRRISLLPADVACIVFWTKNPIPLLERLALLESFEIPFYFLITINSYSKAFEPYVPSIDELLPVLSILASRIGAEKIHWRYDPIILTDEAGWEYHYRTFETIASVLQGCTQRCIISFFQSYKKSLRNLMPIRPHAIEKNEMLEIAFHLAHIARKYGIALQWCAPDSEISSHEYNEIGILRAGCIDGTLVEKLSGFSSWKRDSGQRKTCLCAQSIDIGAYNTCAHGCRYCYATTNHHNAHAFHWRFDQKAASLTTRKPYQFSSSAPSSKSKNLPI